jgi:hypothetical protein
MKFLTEIPNEFVRNLEKSYYRTGYENGTLNFDQSKFLEKNIEKYSLKKFKSINCEVWNRYPESIEDRLPELLMVSITTRIEIDELIELIKSYHAQTNKFLYLAINKFKIFSNTDKEVQGRDHDHKLINYCSNQIKNVFSLIDYRYIKDDDGTYGNFVHPATQLFLCKTIL